MDYKKSIINLFISLIASPIIVYVFLMVAKLFGSTYDMSHGDTFIIWVLMAILVNLSITKKA